MGVGTGGMVGEDGRGGAATVAGAAGSLVMEGGGGGAAGAAGFGSLMPQFDRMPGIGDVTNSPPGPFIGADVNVGGGGGPGAQGRASPQGSVHDGSVGVSGRPLSPLMPALGDSAESPPGLPRLRTLGNPPAYLPSSSSSPLVSGSLAALQDQIPSPSDPTGGPTRSSPSFDALSGPDGGPSGAVVGADDSRSSREVLDPRGSGSLGGAQQRNHQEGVGVGGGEEAWARASIVGGDQGGQDEGDDEDPRKRLRIEELLH